MNGPVKKNIQHMSSNSTIIATHSTIINSNNDKPVGDWFARC